MTIIKGKLSMHTFKRVTAHHGLCFKERDDGKVALYRPRKPDDVFTLHLVGIKKDKIQKHKFEQALEYFFPGRAKREAKRLAEFNSGVREVIG